MGEFEEKEYEQVKFDFIEDMIMQNEVDDVFI